MISAYIMPHPPCAIEQVGYRDLDKMQLTINGYKEASKMLAKDKPETIIVISPHATMYRDAFYISNGKGGKGNLAQFGAPDAALSYDYDTELIDEIVSLCDEQHLPTVLSDTEIDDFDHGTMVPLLFISKEYSDFKIVRISPSFMDSSDLLKMGRIIERAAMHVGRNITILASGDLSHRLKDSGPYDYAPEGPEFDKRVTDAMKTLDTNGFCKLMDDHSFLDKAGQCGTPGFVMMAGALENYEVDKTFLSYEGPFGVGYAVCAYTNCQDKCVKLATKVINEYISSNKRTSPNDVDYLSDWMLKEQNGVFVSIKENGSLRGCIGTFLPTCENVAEEICRLAISASTEDPRFYPITKDELDKLVINVDVLSKPIPATFEELNAKKYGVIVTDGYRRGLLLPDLEGVDTPKEQIEIALQKARIDFDTEYKIEKFTVERHK